MPHWCRDGLARSSAGSGQLLPWADNRRVGGAMPHRFGLRSRTAVLTNALIFVGFWLTGVLSQSPYFRSYSNQVTLRTLRQRLHLCSDTEMRGRVHGVHSYSSAL